MTLKNEEWIIDTTFPIIEKISDEIIVANNNSSDKSVELLRKYNVEIINSDSTTHSNKIRWKLLDEARKRYGNNNLIMCIDADEFVPPELFLKSKNNIESESPGTVLLHLGFKSGEMLNNIEMIKVFGIQKLTQNHLCF